MLYSSSSNREAGCVGPNKNIPGCTTPTNTGPAAGGGKYCRGDQSDDNAFSSDSPVP